MQVNQFSDIEQFYAKVKDYLLSQEALHNLLLGVSYSLIHHPERYEEIPYLASVEVEDKIVAVAMRTPPQNLILSKILYFPAVEAIAKNLYLSSSSVPGVIGLKSEAQKFALVWSSLTHQSYKLKLALRTFQLEKVEQISLTPGYLRKATEADREILIKWYQAFAQEALGETTSKAESWTEWILKQGNAYLWEDKVAVSIVCRGSLTPNGVRIGMVYTPPEYRRQGYASASVATLSQTLLNQGHRFCFLFTDLANPTSNHIYQKIGYKPVGDWEEYSFI